VLSLKLKQASSEETIPYMAIQADTDWETVDQGHSESGDYIIEECFDEDLPNTVLRRLIFLQNQNFIQTEVRLVMKSAAKGAKKTTKGKKKGAKKTTKSALDGEEFEFDYTYLDAHHCAALASLSMLPNVVNNAHKIPNPATASTTATTSTTTALLVGLGGGALPMCLQRYLPNLHLYMCDLDSSVEAVAKEHFGFKCNARSTAFVADGIDVIDRVYRGLYCTSHSSDSAGSVPQSLIGAGQLDVLFIDADSKDTTLGISAPPAAFLTLRTLLQVYDVLKPGGAVYFNVVARSKSQLAQVVGKLVSIFNVDASSAASRAYRVENGGAVDLAGIAVDVAAARVELVTTTVTTSAATANAALSRGKMYHVRASEETMNEGLLVVKGSPISTASAASAASAGKGGSANSRMSDNFDREAQLESWLKVRRANLLSSARFTGVFVLFLWFVILDGSLTKVDVLCSSFKYHVTFLYNFALVSQRTITVCGHGRRPFEAHRNAGPLPGN